MDGRPEMDRYLILVRDLLISRPAYDIRSRSIDSISSSSEYLKGTILHEVLLPNSFPKVTCIVMDSQEAIKCDEDDVEELTMDVMLLLRAISSCKERYKIFCDKRRLADGLEMQPGCDVIVRLSTMSGEVFGKLRYKGLLHNQIGTRFGVELINVRGKGNTNGTINKRRYFDCPDECGIFLPLNRIMSMDYDNFRMTAPTLRRNIVQKSMTSSLRSSGSANSGTHARNAGPSSQPAPTRPAEPEPIIGLTEEDKNNLQVHIGMEVYIFTEVRGRESQERGTVKFIGRMPKELPTSEIYVGIDLDNPVGNGRGVFNKRQLFQTKSNHAALVPLTGVLAASTCDDTPPLAANTSKERSTVLEQSNGNLLHKQSNNTNMFNGEPQYRVVYDERDRDDKFSSHSTFPRQKVFRSAHSSTVPLDDDGYLRPFSTTTMPRQSYPLRGMPDGRPLPDFDEDLHSQIDIYGGNGYRQQPSSGQDKRFAQQKPSTFQKSTILKPRQNFNAESLDFSSSYLEVGSTVEVIDGVEHLGDVGIIGPLYGVIRWIGTIPHVEDAETMAGVELEMSVPGLTDGLLYERRCFTCPPERALFVYLHNCRTDPRFSGTGSVLYAADLAKRSKIPAGIPTHRFGGFEASSLPGRVKPPTKLGDAMIGKGKGIQGHHNSCYLDSTLFSLFAYSYCLDSILFRDKIPSDLQQYQDVQQVLKEDIVNPLRKRNFVRADKIMKLREMLDKLGSVTGLTNEEKDPEEFLQTLLNHVFKAEPLFELRQGDSDHIQECYFYQIFMDKDEKMVLPSTQLLIEQSFLASDLKFREVPVCLILQMPRFGKDYKMYNRVRPSLTLDVTDMLEKLPRSCTVCGGLAEYECQQCSKERSIQEHISSYCDQCAKICHQHPMRRQHEYRKIEVFDEYRTFVAQEGEAPVARHVLDLYAVVCIETSHYVAFAKCGRGRNAKWCFFDSMADRVGEQNGYNVPEVTHCDQFEEWLEMDQSKLLEMDQKEMPEHMRRLLCDAYMCLYQSWDRIPYT